HVVVARVRGGAGAAVGGDSPGEHAAGGRLHPGGGPGGLAGPEPAAAPGPGGGRRGGHRRRRSERMVLEAGGAGMMLENIDWYVVGAILVLALCSLLTRAGYMLFGDYVPLPDGLRRALRYAPAAALTGIIVPEVLPWQAGTVPTLDVKAAAAIIAILLYWKTRNSLLV